MLNSKNFIEVIGQYAFFGCCCLTSIAIPNKVKTISEYAFSNCYSLSTLTIGSGVTVIDKQAFYYTKGLAITINAVKPPAIKDDTFETISSCKVPSDTVDEYKLKEGWSKFAGKITSQ